MAQGNAFTTQGSLPKNSGFVSSLASNLGFNQPTAKPTTSPSSSYLLSSTVKPPSSGLISSKYGDNGIPVGTQGGMDYATPTAAKLGNNAGMIKPTTAVKSVTSTDGTKTEYHAPIIKPADDPSNKYNTDTGKLNPNYADPNASAPIQTKPTTPQVGTAQQNAQNVLNAGQATPLEQKYIDQTMEAQKMQNAGSLGKYADASLHTGDTPEQLYNGLIAAPDLAGRASADTGLYNTFGNIYGSASTQGLTAANTIAGRGLTAANNVLGASLPGQQGLTSTLYNPLDGSATSGTNNSILDRAALAGKVSATTDQAAQVQQYQSALQQGQNLQAQLTDLIKTFGLNPNDLNLANSGIQKIAQNTSDPHYKQLQNYVNDIANTYAQILTPPGGSATDQTRSIATSMLDATASGQSLISVMKSLDEAAKAKIAGVQTYSSNSAPSSSSGSIWSF